MRCSRSLSPKFGLNSISRSSVSCLAIKSSSNTDTTWPKMIGSATFIMVAFKCTENNTPLAFASASWSLIKPRSAVTFIKLASTTVPAVMSRPSFSTVFCPCWLTNRIVKAPACASETVAEISFETKSCAGIETTCVAESARQTPILCGFCIA